jgi:hypothetical protein
MIEEQITNEMQEDRKKMETQMQELVDRKVPEFLLDPNFY